jgi:exodeoxyribonuclease-3
MLKLASWNVNGLRAIHNKGFKDWVAATEPDILCIQETKAHFDQLTSEHYTLSGLDYFHFHSALKKGYSGTATFTNTSKVKLINTSVDFNDDISKEVLEELTLTEEQFQGFNSEGRLIKSEYEEFTLFNIYFPNGKASDERYTFKLKYYEFLLAYLKKYQQVQPKIIITGDFNTAHHAIDLARPKQNEKVSGFIPEERAYLDQLEELGFFDSLRMFEPETPDLYSWWSYRAGARERNVGWRIDYFYVANVLADQVKSASLDTAALGSDHCPVILELEF